VPLVNASCKPGMADLDIIYHRPVFDQSAGDEEAS